MLKNILPTWVEADPLRSRAVDALGLQTVADRLADRLVPGLSVMTTRARYFSFFCWARDKSGKEHDETEIHRWEVALAFCEADQHGPTSGEHDPPSAESAIDDDTYDRCTFFGSRSVTRYRNDTEPTKVPDDPRRVYKVPGWRAYRASMVALGLLNRGRGFALTDDGNDLARHFRRAVCPKTPFLLPPGACLSLVSANERGLLRNLFGLGRQGRIDDDATDPRKRRALTSQLLQKGETLVDLLNEYERAKPRQRLHGPKKILHAAAIWERLSLGLNMLFVEWVRKHSGNGRRQFEREVSAALRSRQGAGAFADIDLDKLDSPAIVRGAVASLRKALDLREALPDEDQKVFDSEMFTLAERLVHSRGDFFQEARRRHLDVKGDDAWINENGELGDREGNSLLVPSKVRLHPYRIEAFARIIRDLA